MKGPFPIYLLIPACLAMADFTDAQEKPRPKRPKPIVSPNLQPDGKVTFRVKAPDAEEVEVAGQMTAGRVPMERGEEGIWSATVGPVAPGIYEYSFFVDGFKTIDPGNPRLKPMRSPQTSILHIPGQNVFDFQDVAHGTVHYHAYHSASIGRFREMKVYTPPGYESSGEAFPLLILQHGHSDTFATWTEHGKAHWIFDNLIATGEAVPMIVAMLDGHSIPESYGDGRSSANVEELRQDMLEAAIPLIESTYRVKPGREHRAIAGLSMGGLHSLTIGMNEQEHFAWIGAFSSAIPELSAVEGALKNPSLTNEQLNLLWIACGKDDFLIEENRAFVASLEEAGVEHTWTLTDGGHSWPVWRDYLTRFAPLLFR